MTGATLNATSAGAQCIQFALAGISAAQFDGAGIPSVGNGDGSLTSEDCLSLDIYLPPGAAPEGDEKLPILLYMHGGG
jgi:carboxylesterase type B